MNTKTRREHRHLIIETSGYRLAALRQYDDVARRTWLALAKANLVYAIAVRTGDWSKTNIRPLSHFAPKGV